MELHARSSTTLCSRPGCPLLLRWRPPPACRLGRLSAVSSLRNEVHFLCGEPQGPDRGQAWLRQTAPKTDVAVLRSGRPSRGETRCIRVEHIPPQCASEAAVRQFFNPFGMIAGVSVDKGACTAMVGFSNAAEAERALASPQPIFGNRFVRTYRAQEDPVLFAPVATEAIPEDISMDGRDADKVTGTESSSTDTGPASAVPSIASSQARTAAADQVKAKAAERARQLEANSARQKEVLGQLEAADKEQKRALLKELRSLTEIAERLLREAKEAGAAQSVGPEDARARLHRLRREVGPFTTRLHS